MKVPRPKTIRRILWYLILFSLFLQGLFPNFEIGKYFIGHKTIVYNNYTISY